MAAGCPCFHGAGISGNGHRGRRGSQRAALFSTSFINAKSKICLASVCLHLLLSCHKGLKDEEVRKLPLCC